MFEGKNAVITQSVVYLCVLAMAALLMFFWVPAEVNYSVSEQYTISSDSQTSYRLGVLVPKTSAYQTVTYFEISPPPIQAHTGSASNLYLFAGSDSDQYLINIEYQVFLTQGQVRWDAPISEYQLRPQPEIESDDDFIIELAEGVASGTSRDSAYKIYDYVSKNINWRTGSMIGGNQSAKNALQEREGVCGDFSNAMVALCRARGIPAQTVSGIYLTDYLPFLPLTSVGLHPGGSHAWVEVYTGTQWEMADVGFAARMHPILYFGRNDGHHLSYGEVSEQSELFDKALSWVDEESYSGGFMTAPLRYASAYGSEEVSINPNVSVTKTWDGRYVNMIGTVILLGLLIRVYETRAKADYEKWCARRDSNPGH